MQKLRASSQLSVDNYVNDPQLYITDVGCEILGMGRGSRSWYVFAVMDARIRWLGYLLIGMRWERWRGGLCL